jgi:hypothetical protein
MGVEDAIMTTARDPTNLEENKEEKVTTASLQTLLEKFTVSLPIGEDSSPISIRVCENNPHFNIVLNTIFADLYSGFEWHFVQELYQATLLTDDNAKQEKTIELMNKYITPAKDSKDIALNINQPFLQKIAENVKNGGGLDSFLPLFGSQLPGESMKKLVKGNVVQNNKLSKAHTLKLRVAYEQDEKMSPQDKLMLPIRSVICSTIKNIEELKLTSKTDTFLQITKNTLTRSNSAIIATNQLMQMMQNQLGELLKVSAQPKADPMFLQKRFQEVMEEQAKLIKARDGLKEKLGHDHPQVRKIDSFISIIADAISQNNKLNQKDSAALVALVMPENTARVQIHMEPIELQIKEAAAERQASVTSTRPRRG